MDFKGGQKERQGEAINTLLNKISPNKDLSANKLRESAKNIIKQKQALYRKRRGLL